MMLMNMKFFCSWKVLSTYKRNQVILSPQNSSFIYFLWAKQKFLFLTFDILRNKDCVAKFLVSHLVVQ
jgi:hypothetical protein